MTTPAGARRRAAIALSAPGLIWYAIFMVGPLLAVFAISFLSWKGILAPRTFAGLANYQRMLGDPNFWNAARNTVVQLAITLPIMIPAAFMLGFYLTRRPRGHRLLKVLLFTPALISLSATAMVFYAILGPIGMLNATLENLGLGDLAKPWLASEQTALASIIVVGLWQGIGFTAILFSARLESISSELYEAARLDGASDWRVMWGIAFPISYAYVGTLAMLQYIWMLFASAGLILLLTRGGPGTASTTLSLMVYKKAFLENELGYSQAIGVVLFFAGLVGMLVIRRVFREKT